MREIRGRRAFVVEGEYLLRVPDGVTDPPVVLLLHGYGDSLDAFVKRLPLDVPGAAILHAAGPLPVELPAEGGSAPGAERSPGGGRRVGQVWYCYDGDADRFRDALEEAEAYLDSVLDDARKKGGVDTTRLVVAGYSMGAYVAGYFALRREPRPLGLGLIAGRLKHELLETRKEAASGLPVLLLSGKADARFPRDKAEEGRRWLEEAGARVEVIEHPGGHGLAAEHVATIETWARRVLAQSSR